MKKCTHCGKEYSDEATVCAIDTEELIPIKTDQELLAMLASPSEHLPEALNEAAEELARRNIDTSHLWTIVRPCNTSRASRKNRHRGAYFLISGLLVLMGCMIVQIAIYCQYDNQPIRFYIDKNIDPREKLAPLHAMQTDYSIYGTWKILSIGDLLGCLLLSVSLCYYTYARGYKATLGLLPLFCLVIGILQYSGLLFGQGGQDAVPWMLIALVVAIVLCSLPVKTVPRK